MAKKSKQMRAALEKIDSTKAYSVEEAVALDKKLTSRKIRCYSLGSIIQPLTSTLRKLTNKSVVQWYCQNGTGKTQRVLVFARGAKAEEAKQQVLTSLVKMNSLLKSTVDGLTLTLLLQHQI